MPNRSSVYEGPRPAKKPCLKLLPRTALQTMQTSKKSLYQMCLFTKFILGRSEHQDMTNYKQSTPNCYTLIPEQRRKANAHLIKNYIVTWEQRLKNIYNTLQSTEATLSPKPQLVQRNSVHYTIAETHRKEHTRMFGALHASRRTGEEHACSDGKIRTTVIVFSTHFRTGSLQ